jgi:hypothetical protein
MVLCKCGKAMDKVPDWLQSVTVEFVCNNCPNRKTKNIAFISLEPNLAPEAKGAPSEDAEQEVEPAEEEEKE